MLVRVTITQSIILLNNVQSLLPLGMLQLDMKKPNWIPKQHIPLSAASQKQDGASTSLSVLSDLSSDVADTLKQHLSHFSIHDFWFSSVHESAT